MISLRENGLFWTKKNIKIANGLKSTSGLNNQISKEYSHYLNSEVSENEN